MVRKTFFQRASESLLKNGYKHTHSRKMVGMWVNTRKDSAVVLKNKTNIETFRGYPAGTSALLITPDGTWPLFPTDFINMRSITV